MSICLITGLLFILTIPSTSPNMQNQQGDQQGQPGQQGQPSVSSNSELSPQLSPQISQQLPQQSTGQQQNKMSFPAIHQQARQLLRQYSLEKEAVDRAGIDTPEGKVHLAKAEKIKAILVAYSKRQRLLQQQQQQRQSPGQEGQTPTSMTSSNTGQSQVPLPQAAPIQTNSLSNNNSNSSANLINMNTASPAPLSTPLSQESRSLSQQINALDSSNNVTTTNSGAPQQQPIQYDASAVPLSPNQQLQVRRQTLLTKYQQITGMYDQFKKTQLVLQKRLAEPNLDGPTKKGLQEREHEVNTRIDNCKKMQHHLATQLKAAQQQANQLTGQNRQLSPQMQQGQPSSQSPMGQIQGNAPISMNNINYMNTASGDGSPLSSVSSVPNMKMSNMGAPSGGTPINGKDGNKKTIVKKQLSKTDLTKRSASTNDLEQLGNNKRQNLGNQSIVSSDLRNEQQQQQRAKFQNLNIPDDLTVRVQNPVNVKINNRPSILGGNAINAPSLTNPVMIKPQQFEIEGERVLNKRKLKELVSSIAIEEGEVDINIDGDVEELLLDLADEFVTSVTSFASKLARHRHSDNLDVRDVQLHLERNWNIRIPGYASDEIRMIRKFVPNNVHNSKLDGVFINKSVDKGK